MNPYDAHMLIVLFAPFIFLWGISFGSFLNVVLYRYHTGRPIAKSSSQCMHCGRKLKWTMLVPVLSFVFQKGRCAYCHTKLSAQYPLVELAAGVLFLTAYFVSGLNPFAPTFVSVMHFILDGAILMTLLLIGVYDLYHKIIPDPFAILLGVLTLLRIVLLTLHAEMHFWPTLLTGIGIALPLTCLWLFSGGRWMGLGDAKLALSLGWFLGFPYGISAIVLSFWIGTLPALFLLFFGKKRLTMGSEIPFAPFLVFATLALYVFPIDILRLTVIYP